MKRPLALLLSIATLLVNAQTILQLHPTLLLPKDSLESKHLTSSLNDFLLAARKPNEENKFIYEPEKLETFILLDEFRGIEKSGKFKDDFFYKPYLTNLVPLKDSTWLIQLSYIGTRESTPYLRAGFELIAHKTGTSFVFASPLLRNTKYWKVKKVGGTTFHYQHTLNEAKVAEFNKLATSFDQKLKSKNKTCHFYCCGDLIALEQLIGVAYKSDYNGRSGSVWSAGLGDTKLVVLGNGNEHFDEFDPHDLFHDRLSLVIPRSKVNKPVDEGCAYLYGGSWGLSWQEIFNAFKEQVASNRNTNWMEIKETPVYFQTKGFDNSADYIVNALLVQKIEKEKGFEGVWELLTVGPFEKGNENYYQALEKLAGITKTNYNEKVWELIDKEK
jgi:hypothetical protein